MRVLIVYNHPYHKSYCRAILNSVMDGLIKGNHQYDLINLDEEEFNPVMKEKDLKAFVTASKNPEKALEIVDEKVLEYKEKLERADHLIMIFPVWWELMPALTKGFIDKVIFPGIAYRYNERGTRMISLLERLKGVTMITTMNTPSLIYRLLFGNALKKSVMLGTFWKIGIPNRKWINLDLVKFISQKKREKQLVKIESIFKNL